LHAPLVVHMPKEPFPFASHCDPAACSWVQLFAASLQPSVQSGPVQGLAPGMHAPLLLQTSVPEQKLPSLQGDPDGLFWLQLSVFSLQLSLQLASGVASRHGSPE
jgi:hypothetical protein